LDAIGGEGDLMVGDEQDPDGAVLELLGALFEEELARGAAPELAAVARGCRCEASAPPKPAVSARSPR
jgi:hypothetical protein